ncbi:hypothetical protein KSD_12350 [Ktedonobacter sp. SOSP1-85]|nr:hypothetical protein KSD_12350 [Ktedonobacter sp. SOSP1-85]
MIDSVIAVITVLIVLTKRAKKLPKLSNAGIGRISLYQFVASITYKNLFSKVKKHLEILELLENKTRFPSYTLALAAIEEFLFLHSSLRITGTEVLYTFARKNAKI